MKRYRMQYALFVPCFLVTIGCHPKAEIAEPDAASAVGAPPTVGGSPTGDALERASEGPLAVGDPAPDFQVEKLGGERLTLSQFVAATSGPTILIFDRAHW